MSDAARGHGALVQCDGKVRHESANAARAHVASMLKHGTEARRRGRGGTKISVYRCPHCKGWHVGARRRRSR